VRSHRTKITELEYWAGPPKVRVSRRPIYRYFKMKTEKCTHLPVFAEPPTKVIISVSINLMSPLQQFKFELTEVKSNGHSNFI